MSGGDCWLLRSDNTGPRAHLGVLLTFPQPGAEAVLVSVTALRHNAGQTVILQAGDHPFIRHPSIVLYSDCRIVSIAELNKWVVAGLAVPLPPFTPRLLSTIRHGAVQSGFTPNKAVQLLPAAPPKGRNT
ncbi:MAG: hypothetical protein C0504_16810 [Candidatus Solibacter sp.]|nr:hypothetical protein [Candidatus Solibacter sp.]